MCVHMCTMHIEFRSVYIHTVPTDSVVVPSTTGQCGEAFLCLQQTQNIIVCQFESYRIA